MAIKRVRKTIDVCDRCAFGKEKPATKERTYCVDGLWYKAVLCDPHAEMFDREIAGWTRLSTEIDPPNFARPGKPADWLAQRQAENERTHEVLTTIRTAAAEADFAARRRAELKAEPRTAIPGSFKWRMTTHALDRMDERGFDLEEVLRTAATPEHTYRQPWRGPNIAIYQRDDCRIVVDDVSNAVITVIDRNDRLELEPPDGYTTNPSPQLERKAQ